MPDDPPAPVSVPPHALGGAAASASPSSRRQGAGLPVHKSLPTQQQNPKPTLDALRDVELDVRIELGRARMRIEEVLKLAAGAVVELDRLAGEPVDVYVSDRLVARGEVVVLNDNFAVRVTEILAPQQA
jgi:flagellar motor switch protein FliN/FliY